MARTLRNRKTGEVITVPDEEVGKYIPSSGVGMTQTSTSTPGSIDTDVAGKLKQGLAVQAFADPKNLTDYMNYINLIDKINPPMSEAEKEAAKGKSDFDRVLKLVESSYFGNQETGEGSLAYGRVGGTIQNVLSAFGANPNVRNYNALVESVRPTLAKAAGDVGNLALQEQIAAGKLLPRTVDTPEEARLAIATLRERFGAAPTTLPEQVKGGDGTSSLLKMVPGVTSVENILDATTTQGQALIAQLVGLFDPQAGAQIASPDILGTQTRAAEKIANPADTIVRQLIDSGELLLGAKGLKGTSIGKAPLSEVPGRVVGGTGKVARGITNPGQALKTSGGNLRTSAVKQAEEAGEAISGTKYAKTATSAYKDLQEAGLTTKSITNQYKAAQKFAGKEITPTKAMSLYEKFDKAYTASQKLAKGPVADYHLAVRNFLKDELTRATGGAFEKGTSRIARGYKVGKAAGGATRMAGNAATYALLNRILFGGFGGGGY